VLLALCSLISPGCGQIYNGQLKKGVGFCSLVLLVMSLLVWSGLPRSFGGLLALAAMAWATQFIAAMDAYRSARKQLSLTAEGSGLGVRIASAVLCCVALVGAQGSALHATPIRAYKVVGHSMVPTIAFGDRIMADLASYSRSSPGRGDVVAVMRPRPTGLIFKRVIGLGGDVVEGRAGKIYVNGAALDEPYVSPPHPSSPVPYEFGPVSVPPEQLFVVGDNRDHSWDSRSSDFGPVHRDDVRGKVLYIYWSRDPSRIGRKIR
jgi:signal peptidase I